MILVFFSVSRIFISRTTPTMNILDTVLYTSNAQEYSTIFKQFGIDASTLKLVNDEDLKLLGIKEEEKRAAILQHAANLQIPSKKYLETVIDQKYMLTVLSQMYIHLTKHLATLSIANYRKDVIVTDVRLAPATKCLKNCVETFRGALTDFEEQVTRRKRRKNNKRVIAISLLPGVIIGVVAIVLFRIS